MKLQAMLPVILFAAVSALSVGAYAADAEKTPAPTADKDKSKHFHPRDSK